MRWAALAVAALASLAGGCGSDAEPVATAPLATSPTPTAQVTTATTPTATLPTTTTEIGAAPETVATATTPPGESKTTAASGAGDERPARSPAQFVIEKSGIAPAEVKVPAFLAIELSGVSRDGAAHTLTLSAEGKTYSIRIPAGGKASTDVPGLKAGSYVVGLDGRITAARLTVVS